MILGNLLICIRHQLVNDFFSEEQQELLNLRLRTCSLLKIFFYINFLMLIRINLILTLDFIKNWISVPKMIRI